MSEKNQVDIEKLEQAISTISEADNKLSEIFSDLSSILHKTKDDMIILEKDRTRLEKEKILLQNETNILQKEKDELDQVKKTLEKEKEELETNTKKLEVEKKERDNKIGVLNEKQQTLLREYEILKEDLKRFQEIAADAENKEFDFEEIQNLLKIYMILLEEIWQGQPHYRILYLLHGDKEVLSKEDIKGATGISGAMVLRAIHELAGANLVYYNEDEGTTKLVKRVFPKKNK